MKRVFIKSLIFIGTLLLSLGIFSSCQASHENRTNPLYQIAYRVNIPEAGSISGANTQYRNQGESCTSVSVSVNYGYVFSEWSDGVKTPERTDTNIQSDLSIIAIFQKATFPVCYYAETGGQIKGSANQSIEYLESSKPVEAVPNQGYMFTGWSDGETSPVRQDFIHGSFDITARFERLHKDYFLDDHYANQGNTQKNISLHIDQLNGVKFPVPQKNYSIFGGWYADKERTIQIADESGNFLAGEEIFTYNTNTLYAKWTAKEKISYPILMVFAEEVQATLKGSDGLFHEVHYKLSPLEKAICELIPLQFSKLLNETFYGYITFEVDTYWLQNPLYSENFLSFPYFEHINNALIDIGKITEISSRAKNYRSVLITYSLNDIGREQNLHVGGGLGSSYGFAQIFLDCILFECSENYDLEPLLDCTNHESWNCLLNTYLHEFTHTVEPYYPAHDYHYVLHSISPVGMDNLETTKRFLLNQIIIQNESLGVPHDFWIGKGVDGGIRYTATEGGSVYSKTEKNKWQIWLNVPIMATAPESITAIADPGYRFVKWSDGITTAERLDSGINLYIFEVWAIFEKIE